ncbi:hypothetical protein BCR35DRAFT_307696 [Leucosporidium creatinivorum]|uniref:Autophagy-related protein 101 n=1 Tax=Leucosporidium creatinivorum TaxID=106004 RepID=A0A1Y2ENJ0_9BASI|nr:hypothetical protein BCR35DRAFT_307696 [Leucosporidium creatinivorum]
MSNTPAKPAEVFQQSFSVERQWVKEVMRAVLGTILFHRSVGNVSPATVECHGCTFPVPADPEIDALLSAKTEELTRALLEDGVKSSKLVVALYPTPSSPRQQRPAPPKPRPLAPTVTSALGWFSASAKALATGAEEEEHAEDDAELGQVWEAWIVDVEVVAEGRRGVSEEKLRSQLNDFLLRSLMFVMERTTHVPPITTADLQPFGVQVLVNPSSLPFSVPKAVVTAPTTFPLLHTNLVTPARPAAGPDGRREGWASLAGGR